MPVERSSVKFNSFPENKSGGQNNLAAALIL